MIKKSEVKVFKEVFLCDTCNIELEKSDNVLLSYPPQYTYSCSKCGKTEISFESYPRIFYEDVPLFNKSDISEEDNGRRK